MKVAEISLLLDSYNDIFSDFDPSPYTERALSDDFTIQARKFIKDKTGNKMSLKLLVPASVDIIADIIVGYVMREHEKWKAGRRYPAIRIEPIFY